MTENSDAAAEMRRVAERLSFDASEDVIEACLDRLSDLELADEPDPPASRESAGRFSDDDDNALLRIYDTPRTDAGSGSLAGVSFVIKDNIAVKDLLMTCGLQDISFVPPYDAVVVERLLNAGATVIGKSNMDGLAIGPGGVFSEFGQVRNPVYGDRVPGGSSSGSASAVASGRADAALGTDTGGSVRLPAAYCGLVGVKPTHGVVPRHGLVPLAPSLDTIGPITRDVATAAGILDVMVGPDPRDPAASHVELGAMDADLDSPPSMRIGLPDGFIDHASDELRATIGELADTIDDETDWTTRDVDLSTEVGDIYPHVSGTEFAWLVRQSGVGHGENSWFDGAWVAAFRSLLESGFNEHISMRKLAPAYVDAETGGRSYAKARAAAIRFRQELDVVFETVDLLLMPTVSEPPPRIDADPEHDLQGGGVNTKPFNLAGTPAVAVPAGERDGLPMSVQVAAPAFEDRRALQGARLVERIRRS